MHGKFDLGMDIGSVSVNLVVMNPRGEVLREVYVRHLGETYRTALNLLESLREEFPLHSFRLAAFTGLGGKSLAEVLGAARGVLDVGRRRHAE